MQKILSLFDRFNPRINFNSNDENLKNKITVIFTLATALTSLICHFIAMYLNVGFIKYSSLITVVFCGIVYIYNTKGYILISKTLLVQFSNIILFVTVYLLPKETSYNILYLVIFFTIFCIFELKDQKIIILNAAFIIFSYMILEVFKLTDDSYIHLTQFEIDIFFALNMFYFASGMLACVYFYLENNDHYRKEIIKQEENLNAVIENSQTAIWSVDRDLKILTMNENFIKTTQLINNVFPQKGDNVLNYLPRKNANMVFWENICKSVLNGKKCLEELKITYDNTDIYLEINLYPILNTNKQITGIAFFGKDITKRKIHAEVLNTKNNELLKANKELDLLVYRASHDLRAPLMSVLGLIKVTELEFKDSKGLVNFELMTKSINKLDSYIKDIIDLSRNSRTEINYVEIDFEHIIDDLLNSLVYFEQAEHIEIIKEINITSKFVSDIQRIEIVFNNLISNAIKYHNIHQDQPLIKIKINQNYKEAIIEISDNGLGIEEMHIEHIFNMFYRASSVSKGSGLGLYIVKDAISKLKGKIELKTEFGKGTTFTITLPNFFIEN